MADTLKFGPEWLRQLSGGNSVSTPPPSPAPGFGKYKLADYRYGREEMLALFTRSDQLPDELKEFGPIITEKAQEPLALHALSEEEQRIISQSVNSAAVLRMMGRGAPTIRGRGAGVERGRGRGRGRGEGFMQRGVSYDEMEAGGGFNRPHQRPDGSWDETNQTSYQRPYASRYEETPQQSTKIYQRSLSSENWRDRDEDDGDGDWRKAGGSKWGTRGSWRDRREGVGFEYDRTHQNNIQRGGFSRQYQRSRSSGSWEEEEMPEWSTDGDLEELGTFDASGVFVATKLQKVRRGEGERENVDGYGEDRSPESPQSTRSPPGGRMEKIREADKIDIGDKDINENQTDKRPSGVDKQSQKTDSPRPSPRPTPQTKTNSAQSSDTKICAVKPISDKSKTPPTNTSAVPKQKNESSPQKKQSEKPTGKKVNETDIKTKVDLSTSKNSGNTSVKKDKDKVPPKDLNTKVPKSKPGDSGNKRRERQKSEAEALDQLQETVENMVAGITVIEDEEEEEIEVSTASNIKQPGALAPDHENYNKWFYRDPQGDLQGPFTSSEMAEWFSAGYFTMNLHVRRGCDEKYSPLGELIKLWGRVPFLAGPSPPPLMNSSHASPDVTQQQQQQQDQLQALQQQFLIQQQLVQQQMLMRHIQLQQMQQVMLQLQEHESFKSLPPLQQQQLAMQMLVKQQSQMVPPQQQAPQKLSPRSSETPPSSSSSNTHTSPSYNRSYSTPNTSQGQKQSGSIWDLEPNMVAGIQAADIEAQLKEKLNIEQHQEEEMKYQETLERQKEELRKQQDELQRQKEEIERQRLEMERKKQEEIKKIEEEKRRAQEEKQRLLEDEQRRQFEEEKRRREKEERERKRVEEELRRQEIERQKELQKQQEIQRQEAQQRQQEAEEREVQKQFDIQRRQELQRQQEESLRKQQQEALRKLQQEQLANIQLPSHAQWASNQSGVASLQGGKSLLEIQQQEERERLEREEVQRQQAEVQRQQMLALQQQQQQKSWTNAMRSKPNSTKSLLEIQEEQARQLERERQKREENQQQAAKNLSLGAASVWGSSPPVTSWANEGAWGAIKSSQMNSNNNNNSSLGFWDDAIISSSGPMKKQSNKSGKQQGTAEFPALGGEGKQRGKTATQSKPKPSKSKKEEEAVHKLFQSVKPVDDFTQWCQEQLRNMATSVDIPTFIVFLQEVESPYEVYDYVRSYLGESKAAEEFGKAFLEKRSQYRNKSKPVEEDSIWGPAPAITPRELRQHNPSFNEDGQKGKANKKKKNKMMKVDASILGFTVHAAPDRIVGEIEDVNVVGGALR